MIGAQLARFGALFRDGASSLRGYWRLATAVYMVQLAIATGAAVVMASMLATVFSYHPVFEDAVDGDAFSLAMVLMRNSELFVHLVWVGFGAVALYAVVSWFLVGGLLAVYVERPTSEARRVFGAGGAQSFFAFARLTGWCIIPYGIGFVAMAMGLAAAGDAMEQALTFGEVVAALASGLAPGAVVIGISFAAVDYARIDLVRHPKQSSLRALVRGYRMIATDWKPLAHVACYYLAIATVSALYVVGTFDQPLAALTLLLLRQLVSLVRFAFKLVLMGGQVNLGRDMAAPRTRASRRREAAPQSVEVT